MIESACKLFLFSCVDTLFQPRMTKKKSVSKLDVKDTKSASKYVLTHQEQDSSDELVTKLIKVGAPPTDSIFKCNIIFL